MITTLSEEVLIEVLVRMGKYKIDDEVFQEAKRIYDERVLERDNNKNKNKTI